MNSSMEKKKLQTEVYSISENELPMISVIIPCYNSEKRIRACLNSIKRQDYPQEKLEFIIVDDDSQDRTRDIAIDEYGCTVVRNGTHSIERGKSIGLESAKGEFVFLIDDDNRLPDSSWLRVLVEAVINEGCVGGQSAYFAYSHKDTFANRYASLYGINDPTVFYLNKRDKLMKTEKEWTLPGKIEKETGEYWKILFTKENLPTVGSQGFLIRKDLLMKTTWKPYLYHMDTNMELVQQGYKEYILLKKPVIHKHSETIEHFINKLKRNIGLFYSENVYRKYKYDIDKRTMIKLGLIMGTFIIPIKDAFYGYRKIKDKAWFLHPYICFRVAVIYTYSTIKNILKAGRK